MKRIIVSRDERRFWRAVVRLLAEIDWLRTEQTALVKLIGVECIGLDFFLVAHTALLGDRLLRLVRVLEDSKRVSSFWYLHRCKPKVIEGTLDVKRLAKLSERLKTVRDKTFVHIDKDSVFDPQAVYEEAGIKGSEIVWAIGAMWKALGILCSKRPPDVALRQSSEYTGNDITELVQLRDGKRRCHRSH